MKDLEEMLRAAKRGVMMSDSLDIDVEKTVGRGWPDGRGRNTSGESFPTE